MKRGSLWSVGLAAVVVSVVLLAGCAQRTGGTAPSPTAVTPGNSTTGAQDEWAVCAYDGMVMKKQGMGATAQYQGKTLYFCNDDHQDRFMADPEKYQRTWQALGDDVSFNILPVAEHMQAISDMGLHMEEPSGTTHHVTVCVMAGAQASPVTDLAVSAQLTSPQGKAIALDMPLASDGKHYAANVKLPATGEYQVEVALSRAGDRETHSFTYAVR